VDRQAIARAQRHRQAMEALEFERARADALREQLETVVGELEGAALDESIFASMAPEDVAVVREALHGAEPEEPDEAWAALDWHSPDAEAEQDPAEHEEEIARLQDEIAASRARQQAFERYLAALGGVS
jgi:hypothetical protein